jgi:hypothetical protein
MCLVCFRKLKSLHLLGALHASELERVLLKRETGCRVMGYVHMPSQSLKCDAITLLAPSLDTNHLHYPVTSKTSPRDGSSTKLFRSEVKEPQLCQILGRGCSVHFGSEPLKMHVAYYASQSAPGLGPKRCDTFGQCFCAVGFGSTDSVFM